MARRGGNGGSGWRGGEGRAGRSYIHVSSVTAGDDGEVSTVLRRLDRRTYGGVVSRLEASWGRVIVGRRGPRAAHSLGRRSRREGARARPSRVGRRRAARGCATSRHASARPDTVLLGLLLKSIFSKNLNTTRPNFE
jgi:hypothetical protein